MVNGQNPFQQFVQVLGSPDVAASATQGILQDPGQSGSSKFAASFLQAFSAARESGEKNTRRKELAALIDDPLEKQLVLSGDLSGKDILAGRRAQAKATADAAIRAQDVSFKERETAVKEETFDLKAKEAEIKSLGGLNAEEEFKQTTSLRKDFIAESKPFIQQRDAFERIKAVAKDSSAAGDIALIFNFMKVQDPGSTVREGEFATAQNAAGVPEKIRAKYKQLLTGERLTQKQRNDFLGTSKKVFGSAERSHNNRVKRFGGLADRLKLKKENIAVDIGALEDTETTIPETPQGFVAANTPPAQADIQAEIQRRKAAGLL